MSEAQLCEIERRLFCAIREISKAVDRLDCGEYEDAAEALCMAQGTVESVGEEVAAEAKKRGGA